MVEGKQMMLLVMLVITNYWDGTTQRRKHYIMSHCMLVHRYDLTTELVEVEKQELKKCVLSRSCWSRMTWKFTKLNQHVTKWWLVAYVTYAKHERNKMVVSIGWLQIISMEKWLEIIISLHPLKTGGFGGRTWNSPTCQLVAFQSKKRSQTFQFNGSKRWTLRQWKEFRYMEEGKACFFPGCFFRPLQKIY